MISEKNIHFCPKKKHYFKAPLAVVRLPSASAVILGISDFTVIVLPPWLRLYLFYLFILKT